MEFNWAEIVRFLVEAGLIGYILKLIYDGIKLGVAYVDAIIKEKLEKIKNEKVKMALEDFEDAVETAVLDLAQTEVDELKAAAEDGKLSDEEKERLKNLAKEKALSFLKNDVVEMVSEHMNNFDSYILSKIEALVYVSKK